MAKTRRRSRGLGSSDNRLSSIAAHVARETALAEDHLSRGNCGAAIRSLVSAALSAGRAETHMTSSNTSVVSAIANRVGATRSIIASSCKIR